MIQPKLRIVVAEPFEWKYGSLFGEILSEQIGDEPKVKLTQTNQSKFSK
jgi:hypothetical protein